MFYLGNFFKIAIRNPLSGFIFIFLTVVLILLGINFSYFEKKIGIDQPDSQSGDHFYSLIDARENIARVARKISNLPGVARVRQISVEEIESELRDIFSEIGGELKLETRYGGLQIFYVQHLEKRSQDLIREYLVRLVGRDKVTLGPVAVGHRASEKEESQNEHFIEDHLIYGLLAIIVVFWQISYYIFGKHVVESAYLISQYQQRSRVAFKMFLAGFIVIIMALLGLSYGVGQIDLYGFGGCVAFFIINSFFNYKRSKWKS